MDGRVDVPLYEDMTRPKASEPESKSRRFVIKPTPHPISPQYTSIETDAINPKNAPSVLPPRSRSFAPGTLKKTGIAQIPNPAAPHNHLIIPSSAIPCSIRIRSVRFICFMSPK